MTSLTPRSGRKQHGPLRLMLRLAAALALTVMATCLSGVPQALALSEIKREDLPAPAAPVPPAPTNENPENTVPLPDPIEPSTAGEPDKTGPTTPANPPAPADQTDTDEPIPEIQYDLSKLPPEVVRMRSLILEACKTGDPEKLRPLLGLGDDMTQLSLGEIEGDPIAFIKGLSGDPDGLEILAIMEEVLNAGYVHLDAGTDEELYVWPYFFAIPLEKLTAAQKVELFKIITAGDFEEMKNFGSYIFYRFGITPQGKWAFFVAGE